MDRVRGGRQKYKRQTETGLSSNCRTSAHCGNSSEFWFHSDFLWILDSGSFNYFYYCSVGNKVISHLLLTEPAPLAATHDDSTNDGSLRTLLTLCDLLNRELLVLIGWAKQIPGTSIEGAHQGRSSFMCVNL